MRAKQLLKIAAVIALVILAISAVANADDFLVSENLGQSAYRASASYPGGFAPYLAFDGNADTMWNSGGDGGWIEVNLGRVCDLSKISLVCYPPTGELQNCVWYSMAPIGDGTADGLAAFFDDSVTEYSAEITPGTLAQYVQVQTTMPAGWTNWYEVQVYARPSTLAGKVVSAGSTPAPIEGATVATSDGKYTTTTAADGTYSLPVPAGTSSFDVSKDGYITLTVPSIDLPTDATANRDFTLVSKSSATIYGTVRTNDNGSPAEGAIIKTSDGQYEAITKSDGLYFLPLPAGTYTITASKDGYKDFTTDVTIVSGAQPVSLDITLKSLSFVSVSGTVRGTEAGNPPLAGAVVSTKDAAYSTTTAADGTYTFTVPRTTTSLLSTHATHVIGLIDISTGDNDEISGIDFALEPGLLVSYGLPQSSYLASRTYPGWGPELAFDGSFQNASRWVADTNLAWIEADLGGSYLISKVLLSACMLPSGDTTEELRISDSPIRNSVDGATLAYTFTGLTEDLTFKQYSPNIAGRYIQVKTTSNPSWASWYEVQVYSAICTVSGTVKSTENGESTVFGATVATQDGKYSTVTDKNGQFSLTLPAGNLRLKAFKDGYSTAFATTTTQANGTATVNFDLKSSKTAGNIKDLKGITDGVEVALTNPMVAVTDSYTFLDGGYYIEELNRTAGIKVIPDVGIDTVNIGDRANFDGIMCTDNATGERYIQLLSVTNKAAGDPVGPLGIGAKSIVESAISPEGVLITTWGKVTYVEEHGAYMYIDDGSGMNDGSGYTGIKVMLNATTDLGLPTAVAVGDYVSVTGIVQPIKAGSVSVSRVLPCSAKYAQEKHAVLIPDDASICWEDPVTPMEEDFNPDSETAPLFTDQGLEFHISDAASYNQVHFRQYDGLPLKDLTDLKYSTYVAAAPVFANATPALKLVVDVDGDNNADQFLLYQPDRIGTGGQIGTWQVWDAFKDGLWWSAKTDWSGAVVPIEQAKPLSAFIADNPGIKLCTDYDGAVVVFASDGTFNTQSGGLVATLGSLTVGSTTSGTVVYSFAPEKTL